MFQKPVLLVTEPHPGIRHQLEFNASLNPDLNVEIWGYAISDQSGKALMKTGKETSITRIEDDGDIEVECRTLLEVIELENLSHIDALKVNVEGYEDKVLMPLLYDSTPKSL